MKKIVAVLLAVFTVIGSAGTVFAGPPVKEGDAETAPSPRRLLVGAEDESVISKDADRVVSSCGGLYLIQYATEEEAEKAYANYEKTASFVSQEETVTAASENPEQETASPGDDSMKGQDALTALQKTLRSAGGVSGKNTIAVLDTGMEGDGVAEAVSLIGDDAGDDCGHGTRTLKTLRSVNPEASVLSIKVLDAAGRGSVSSISAGIEYAIRKNVRILLLPLYMKSSGGRDAVSALIRKAVSGGMTVVGAAGNEGKDAAGFIPGGVDEVLVAGSCDEKGNRNRRSNYGKTVDFYAVSGSTSEASAKLAGFVSKTNRPALEALMEEAAKSTWIFRPADRKEVATEEISSLPAPDPGEDTGKAAVKAADENLPIYAYQLTSNSASTYYYTTNPDEISGLSGWNSVKEAGIIGYSSAAGGEAIYRMRYEGQTGLPPIYAYVGAGEISGFEALGYRKEGTAFFKNSGTAKIYRLHNPGMEAQYMFTPNSEERAVLIKAGWNEEGAIDLSDMSYPKTPAFYRKPEQVNGRFIDEKMILANQNCRLTSVNVSGIASSEYTITSYAPTGQRGVKFRTAGAAEQAAVTARFTNAGTYMSGGERIPIDYTLTFTHGIAYAAGDRDYYRPKRTFMQKGEYGLYFDDNPSEASILNLGLLSVDCEMKLYRSSDGEQIIPSGAYLTFGSLNGYHDYEPDHFYDVEGVCALAPVSQAYVTGDTILRTGVYENYDRFMDPNNKGRSGYYGWQNSPSDFQDGESTKAVTYNRSCVTLVFDSSIRFAIQTYETRKGMVHWSLDAYPIGNTRPDQPVKSAADADGKPVSSVRKGQKVTYRIDQKVNTWAENAISKYSVFKIRDTLPEGIRCESVELLCNGKAMAQKDYSTDIDHQDVTCSLSDDYLLNMPMEGETYTLVIRCVVTSDGGHTLKNHAVTEINHSEFISNEVTLTVQKTHAITTRVENGTIDESIREIPEGESRTIHYAPKEGFVLESVTVDGVLLTEEQRKPFGSSYPFENITADHEIAVVYGYAPVPLAASKEVFQEDGKTDADGKTVVQGRMVLYRISFKNPYPGRAAFTVRDVLPEGTEFVSLTEDGTFAEGAALWKIDLGEGEAFSADLRVRITGSGKIVNRASVLSGSVTAWTNPVTVYAGSHQKLPTAGGEGVISLLICAACAAAAGAAAGRKGRRRG